MRNRDLLRRRKDAGPIQHVQSVEQVVQVELGDNPEDLTHRRQRRITVNSLRRAHDGSFKATRFDEVVTPDSIVDVAYRVLFRDLQRFDDATRERELTSKERKGVIEVVKAVAALRRIDLEIERQQRLDEQGMTVDEARAWIAANAPQLLGAEFGRQALMAPAGDADEGNGTDRDPSA